VEAGSNLYGTSWPPQYAVIWICVLSPADYWRHW